MPLITMTRPAPPAPLPIEADRAPLVAVLRFLFWSATLKPLLQGAAVATMSLYWLVNNTREGRHRYHLRAVWAAAASLYVAPWTPWAWIALAVAFDAWHVRTARQKRPADWPEGEPWKPTVRWVSAREQRVLARGCALAAGWSVVALDVDLPWRWTHIDAGLLTCDVPWSWGVPIWLPLAVAAVWPWSKHRRVRPDVAPVEEEVHPLVEQWHLEVSMHPKAGPLAFTELRHDPATDRFHLRAPIDGEEGVEGAAQRACRLMCRPRGTVVISPDPDGDANDFLVALTDRHDAAAVRYWSDGEVSARGTFETADSADGRTALAAVRGPSGAAHVLILAPSRHGKGIVMRQFGVALARWDQAFLMVADCKGEYEGGAGVPELRHGADVYGWTRDQWRAVIEMSHELLSARASRYGRAGRNFWSPNAIVDGYADPLMSTMIDEQRKLIRAWGGALVRKLEDIASQGASFGHQIIVNTQKGDADSLGSTTFRNDLRGNGTVYIGRYADAQAARDAIQGFDLDPLRLPAAPGWWYIRSALTPIPLVPHRARMLPTRDELEFMDFTAPSGTVEDWLVGTKRAKLHPQDQDIVEKYRREWFADESAVAEPEPVVEVAEPAVSEPAPGVHVEAAPRLHLVPAQSSVIRPARELIPDLLRTAGRAMTRGEIADRIGVSKTYVSGLLTEMEGQAVKRATTPDGKPGWTVAA